MSTEHCFPKGHRNAARAAATSSSSSSSSSRSTRTPTYSSSGSAPASERIANPQYYGQQQQPAYWRQIAAVDPLARDLDRIASSRR